MSEPETSFTPNPEAGQSHGEAILTESLFSTTVCSSMRPSLDTIICGDNRDALQRFPAESIDLIVTSPPYADRRSKTYGGIKPDAYVRWFLPIAEELRRVLKPTGSFVLNIKEIVVEGERHTYVIELILEMRKRGWLWTEDYVWHKKNCYPGKWPNRFRDSWERCLQFTKARKFAMYQEAVRVPMGDWRHSRLRNLSETDRTRDNSRVKSGFGKKVANWIGRDLAYPTNVLHMATECGNKNHSATFPVALPSWFIKLFTKAGDVVLDPFMGSGTTAVACKQLGRHYIGIDINPEFCEIARQRLRGASIREKQDYVSYRAKKIGTADPGVPSLFLQASNSRT
jgi:site-specific DNA-methyltransferase (adenine-specific)